MLQDEDYIKETRNLILSERDRMIRELRDTDTYKIYPAYANLSCSNPEKRTNLL